MHTRKCVHTGIQGACGRLEGLRACYSPGATQGLGMGVQVRSPLLKVQWKEMMAELPAREMGRPPAPPSGADSGPRPPAPTWVPALHAHPGPWPACVSCRPRFLPGPAGVITGNMKNAPLGSFFKNAPSIDGLLTAAHRVSGVNMAIKGPGSICQLE